MYVVSPGMEQWVKGEIGAFREVERVPTPRHGCTDRQVRKVATLEGIDAYADGCRAVEGVKILLPTLVSKQFSGVCGKICW